MSRLYIETLSDIGKGTGKGASETATARIKWGSAGDSKRAAEITVTWPKGQETPEVFVNIGEEENRIPLDSIYLQTNRR